MTVKRKSKKRAKVIVIYNGKGGVAKTATVTTLSHLFAREYKQKVCAIDLDPQGNTSNMFGDIDILSFLVQLLQGNREQKEIKSVEDLLIDPNIDIHEAIQHTQYENLDVIPAFLTLSEVEERLKADSSPQQFRLKNHIKNIEEEYDLIVMDCSPSVSIVNINGLACADEVYIPMRCDAWSAVGMCIAKDLVNTVTPYNPTLKIGGCFFTAWTETKNVSKEVQRLLEEFIGNDLLPITISASKTVEEMSYTQLPLGEAEKRKMRKNQSKALHDYRDLAEYILSDNKKKFKKDYVQRKIELL